MEKKATDILVKGCQNVLAIEGYSESEGTGKPSEKFIICLWQFANSTYLLEGCQYPLTFDRECLVEAIG
jgi:hypothetical protein